MRPGLKITGITVAVVALATTAAYWRNRALRLERVAEDCLASIPSLPGIDAPSEKLARLGNLPTRAPGRRVHQKKPPWKRMLAEKLRREEQLQRATDKELEATWDAIVSEALDAEIKRRLGEKGVEESDREKLLAQLRRVRDIGELQAPADGEEGERKARLLRTVALLQADQIFRDLLGVGISEFVAGLDGDRRIQQISQGATGD